MKKRLFSVFTAFLILSAFIFSPIIVYADDVPEQEEAEAIELSNDDYENYVKSLIRPSFFENFINGMNASAEDVGVQITNKNWTDSNAPRPSGVGSVGSALTSGIVDFGADIIKDIITTSMIDNSGNYKIPEFRQESGKLRNEYANGVIEIITCTLTFYQTQTAQNTYKNHFIMSFIRQIGNYYTITTICDTDSEKYCQSYNDSGTVSAGSYYPQTYSYTPFYDAANDVTYSTDNRPLGYGVGYNSINFSDLSGTNKELGEKSIFYSYNILFLNYSPSGISAYISGSNYYTISQLLSSTRSLYNASSAGSAASGLAFTASNSITNQYADYTKKQLNNDNKQTKQSVTYLNQVSNDNVINSNNINEYSYLTIDNNTLTTNSNFSGVWNDTVNNIDNSVTNNYYNYWYIGQPETEPVETIPTQATTTTTTTITTTTTTESSISPPETAETYPPFTLPDAEPKYTLDMDAVHSDLDYVKNQASEINIGRSFWIVRMFEKIMTDTGFFPLFFFVFLMGVLGVLLWK